MEWLFMSLTYCQRWLRPSACRFIANPSQFVIDQSIPRKLFNWIHKNMERADINFTSNEYFTSWLIILTENLQKGLISLFVGHCCAFNSWLIRLAEGELISISVCRWVMLVCLALLLVSESDDPSTSSGVTDVLAICFVSLSVITETLEHFLGLGRMVC